ncbi:hypothetical protein EXIGLDRAFT_728896 [Exidia glandulosa HHB12029]|uniref:F-box domain-containing protein n=1 Tax=Exidia glandulosa HHB12029 TaxID=1314781 RepID=A0A165CTB1_EXIGL|nr:hypothetical protein EXIGLDRAFT_728896 [Exidia glandulosa HHB12029]
MSAVVRSLQDNIATTRSRLIRRGEPVPRRPLDALPIRVLRHLGLQLDLVDLIRLTHTGRGIRQRLLNEPDVWRNLSPLGAVPLSFMDRLGKILPRSVPSSVCLQLGFTVRNFETRAPILSEALPRTHELSIRAYPTPAVAQILRTTLSTPAPMLKTLFLVFLTPGEVTPGEVARTLFETWEAPFADCAPNLRTCVLWHLPASCLSHRVFRALTACEFSSTGNVESKAVRDVLHFLPCLVTFVTRGAAFVDSPLEPSSSSENEVATTRSLRLKNVLIDFRTNVNVQPQLLKIIPFLSLRHLIIMRKLKPILDILGAFHIEHVCFGLNGWTLEGKSTQDAPEQTLIDVYELDVLSATPVHDVHPPLLRHITQLAIHEFLWPHDIQPPPLPSATMICICLSTPTTAIPGFRPVFLSANSIFAVCPGAEWEVPLLEEVRLFAPAKPGERPLGISLLDVGWFIRTAFTFDAMRLRLVHISGCELVGHDFCAAWSDLHLLAQEVALDEVPDAGCYKDVPLQGADVVVQLTSNLDASTLFAPPS